MKYHLHNLLPCLGLSLAIVACSKEKEKIDDPRPVQAMQVGVAENMNKTVLSGKAKATREVDISFEVSGKIVIFSAEVGTKVKRGDSLAQLDPRDYQNAVTAAEAEVERAEALLTRLEKAFKGNAVSAQAVTDAKAQVKAASASLRIAKKHLEDTVIKAPFSGRIAAKYFQNYENVIAKQKVLRLLDLNKIEMIVNVPENLIPSVPYVDSIEVTFSAFPHLKIQAHIKEISSEASELTRTYPITLMMDQPANALVLPGMAGEAIATAKLPANLLAMGVTILPASISSSGGESYVWVIDRASGVVSKTKVEVDRFTPSGMVVTKGLQPGQWIATAGVNSLTDGQKVRILGSQ